MTFSSNKTLLCSALLLANGIYSVHAAESEDMLIIEDDAEETLTIEEEAPVKTTKQSPQVNTGSLELKLDKMRLEYGIFTQRKTQQNHFGYGHAKVSMNWHPSDTWQFYASARVDGYTESGKNDWGDVEANFDEIYIRHKSDNGILTLGSQRILWGRIDEFPPTDHLSTRDLRRFVLDDYEERRLPNLAIRYEHFFGNHKVDMVFYPRFRETELADKESTWYPVNKRTGEVLTINTTPLAEFAVKNVPIKEEVPNSEGGGGIRLSGMTAGVDYGVSVQRGRQALPYFSYNAQKNQIQGDYHRTWVVAADAGIETMGGTVKLEAAWSSDTPVTRMNGSHSLVNSVSWGAAYEFFPGDGDARVNLQLTGRRLQGTPKVMDRSESYIFNGSFDIPVHEHRWHVGSRFYMGLDEQDVYLNPYIKFTGIEAQKIYLEYHFFEGNKGTPGGFFKENDVLTLGWESSF